MTREDPQARATGNATLSGTILKNGEADIHSTWQSSIAH